MQNPSPKSRYRLISRSSPGLIGSTVQALDLETMETVQLVRVPIETEYEIAAAEACEHDRAALLNLEHANIASLRDVFRTESQLWIVNEWVEARTLGDVLKGERMSLARLKLLFLQVCAGLADVHALGFSHGALSLDTISVTHGGQVKLLYTGCHELLRAKSATRADRRTSLFSAPEVCAGVRPDATADIYALGVIMYQAATGLASAARGDAQDSGVLLAVENLIRTPVPPADVSSQVPADWNATILKMMSATPADRYASAAELQNAVAELTTVPSSSVGSPATVSGTAADIDARPPTRSSAPATSVPDALPVNPTANFDFDPLPKNRLALAITAGITAVVLLLAVIVLWVSGNFPGRQASPAGIPSIGLQASGALTDAGFASGQTVTLEWPAVRNAAFYHLEVAYAAGAIASRSEFARPAVSVVVYRPRFELPVVGVRHYFWHVQAYENSAWSGFSRTMALIVSRPTIPVPVPLLPVNGSTVKTPGVRLCWSRVPSAVDYQLRVGAQPVTTVTGTCEGLAAHTGRYVWSVAARIKGAEIYAGAFSAGATFTVAPPSPLRKVARPKPPAARPTAVPAPPIAVAPAPQTAPAPISPVQPRFVQPAPPVRSVAPPAPVAPQRPANPPPKSSCIPFVTC